MMTRSFHLLIILSGLMCAAFPFVAPAAEDETAQERIVTIAMEDEENGTTFTYSRDQDTPVVTLERWPGELRSEVPGELIEVFGNGLLRVTYPEVRIFAGTYEMQLSEEETDGLFRDLVESGVPKSDGRVWQQEARKRERQEMDESLRRGDSGIVGHRTSDTLTVIRTRFIEDQEPPRGEKRQDQDTAAAHTFRYHGLASDAERHREMEGLAAAAELEKRLLALADRARDQHDRD